MSDLWILAGQSNMEGCGLLDDLEPSHPNVKAFVFGDRWETAQEPLHWMQQGKDRFHWWNKDEETHKEDIENEIKNRIKGTGVGLTFAKALHAATGIDIDILPAAHGGTSMDQWSPAHKHLGTDSLYAAMIRRTKLALATRPEAKLRGVLWYQGESDCNPAAAGIFKENNIKLIAGIREDLGAPNLPFYYVQLATLVQPEPHNEADEKTWNIVREIQRTLTSEVPNTVVVPAIDLALDDPIHIATKSQRRLAQRFANVALRNVYGKETPSTIDVASVRFVDDRLVVKFSGVNGELVVTDKSGRIPGFGISTAAREFDPHVIYKTKQTAPDQIELFLTNPPTEGASLWYGYGWNPFCQLADTADMAVPAFGPFPIAL